MRKLFFSFIAFLFSITTYSQNIVGKWQSKEDKRMGIVFNTNGTMELIDLENPNAKVLQNIALKYKIKKTENYTFLEIDYFIEETKKGSEKWKFRIENNILFIGKEVTSEVDDITQSLTPKKEEEYIKIN